MSGDRSGLYERIVRGHSADLYRFAARLCGDPELARDLVQETCLEAWRSLDRLQRPEKARAWMFQILRHRWSHTRRRRRARPTLVSAGADASAGADGGVDEWRTSLHRDTLQHCLDRLDDRFKVPLLMTYVQGLTGREVADELGIPLGTVVSRIHRARTQLRAMVAEAEGRPAPTLVKEDSA